MAVLDGDPPWWANAVIYQIYLRSFCDSDGDGVGDIAGVTSRLDYLERLGVDAIWLSPVTVSADCDWGYDVVDYYSVQPELGTLEDLDELVASAGARGIRVLLDLVPNHTSSDHPWFEEARGSRSSRSRDWYVWADPGPEGGPPNNWLSMFVGPAWTLDEQSGQYYLHNFLSCQPDLNWWNPEVREQFQRILRFWFNRGVAGMRIDVAHALVKDRLLRDHPPADETDHPFVRRHQQRRIYSMGRPEVHEILREWRHIADAYSPPRLLLGETVVFDLSDLALFYGAGDELQLAFNFPFTLAEFSAGALSAVVGATVQGLTPESIPVWMASNHDMGRLTTRWADEEEGRVRLALLLLLALPGAACLYAGDEIGLPEAAVPPERLLDPIGLALWPDDPGRDRMRTPMIWDESPGHGFTEEPEKAWLPFGAAPFGTAEEQAARDDSVFALARRLIELRRSWPCLSAGRYQLLSTAEDVWAWKRVAPEERDSSHPSAGPRSCIVLGNFSPTEQHVDLQVREVVFSTLTPDRALSGGKSADGVAGIRLAPREGLIALS